MQTTALIKATFPRGIAEMIARHVVGAGAEHAGEHGCYETCESLSNPYSINLAAYGAAQYGHWAIADMLSARGASYKSLFLGTCEGGHIAHLEKLVIVRQYIPKAMIVSVIANQIESIRWLLKLEPEKGWLDAALCSAVRCGHGPIAEILLAGGADASEGLSAAIEEDSITMVRLMFDNGAQVGHITWVCAGRYASPELYNYFIQLNPDSVETILHSACAGDRPDVVLDLLDPNDTPQISKCVHVAVVYDAITTLCHLLTLAPRNLSRLGLHAARYGAAQIMRWLIEQNAIDTNVCFAITCIESSAQFADWNNCDYGAVFEQLIAHGATRCVHCERPLAAHRHH